MKNMITGMKNSIEGAQKYPWDILPEIRTKRLMKTMRETLGTSETLFRRSNTQINKTEEIINKMISESFLELRNKGFQI